MKTVSAELLAELTSRAAAAPRGRMNHNLHPCLEDPVQRFFNAFEPASYVRPHRHTDPPRWEVFIAARGRAVVIVFDGDDGKVGERCVLDPRGPAVAVEIEAGAWHTLAALESGTVLFELKPGPYAPLADKDFAPWAPAEGEPRCAEFIEWYRRAQVGDRPPAVPGARG